MQSPSMLAKDTRSDVLWVEEGCISREVRQYNISRRCLLLWCSLLVYSLCLWFSMPRANVVIVQNYYHDWKRCIELGLRDDPDESSDEEEQVPEGFTETVKSLTGWVDLEDNDTPPLLSLDNIHHYFVTKRLRRDEVTASKPFEKGYRIYHAKKVNSVSTHCVNEQSQYTIVRAAVSASQRDQVYKTCVAIHKNQGHVLYGYCTCIAGKCSTCNHVAALLFYSDNYNRERATTTQQQPSCTSLHANGKTLVECQQHKQLISYNLKSHSLDTPQ